MGSDLIARVPSQGGASEESLTGARVKALFVDHTALLGGAEIMLEHMVTGLPAQGVDTVVALGSDGPLVARLRGAGVDVHVLPIAPSLGRARRRSLPIGPALAVDAVGWVRAMSRLIRELDVNVVVTNSQKAHVLGSMAARVSGVPLAWRLWDIVEPATFGPAQIMALRLAAREGRTRVIGTSRAVEVAARDTLRIANGSYVYSGVDASRLVPHARLDIRGGFGWPPEAVVFGTIGRLVRWKGIDVLVEAAARVVKAAPMARFIVVGDELIDKESGYRDEILRRVAALGIGDQLRLLPFTDDVGAVLAELDVLVQPSTEPDPFPTAMVEAAVVGVPIIAADHGGAPEIVTDGVHGRLVAPGSVDALADACAELAGDAPGRAAMSQAILRDSAGLTVERMCSELATELRMVAARSRPRRRSPRTARVRQRRLRPVT